MSWHELLPFVVFAVTFITSVLSGMTGGGGGYIITPFMIAIGLTPQQSIATVKLWALGMDSGAITAYRNKGVRHKGLALFLMTAGLAVGFVSALAIRHLKNDNLQLAIGVLNLAMIPILFIKHHEIKSRSRHLLVQGFGLLAIITLMLLQGIFASGVGSLINVFLIAVFGISALETNLMKRRASLTSDIVSIGALIGASLINYKYGFIGMAGGLLGGYIGSKFALHEGEKFARYALMIFMVASGLWLVLTA